MGKSGDPFSILKSKISFFSNSLRHNLISELWRRLFGKRDIFDFNIEKGSPDLYYFYRRNVRYLVQLAYESYEIRSRRSVTGVTHDCHIERWYVLYKRDIITGNIFVTGI